MTRILMTAARCAPKMGGVERHVEAIRTELASMGHEVSVEELGEGARSLLAVPRLISDIRKNRYDVVHAHDFLPTVATWLALRLAGSPLNVYATIHGYEGYPLRRRFIAGHRLAHRIAKRVLAIGAYIDRWYGTKSSAVVHGGVRNAYRSDASALPTVVFVSRLAEDTNCLEIAHGFVSASRRHADVAFAIYGFGPLADAVDKICSGSGVDFRGPTLDAEGAVSGATITIANSYLAILEAFSQEKPVVSYYSNALKRDYLNEIAAASSGMLVVGNPSELDAAITRLLNAPDERRRLAESGAAYARRLLWRNVAADYLNIWGAA